jgi:hypothetical protein
MHGTQLAIKWKPAAVPAEEDSDTRIRIRYMTLAQTLYRLKQARDRLRKAIAALEGTATTSTQAPHRGLSASARAWIAKAQRGRWAKTRAAKKKSA